jgi:arsenate reductase
MPPIPTLWTKTPRPAMVRPMSITIWHNPRCGKSRQTLELLRANGIEPTIREYLKEPPSRAEVDTLLRLVGGDHRALIRDGEPEFKELKAKKADLTPQDVSKAIATHPILLQRPVVVSGKRAAIGRPPEAVLALLK